MIPPLAKPLLFAFAFAVPALADFTQADSAKAAAACKESSFLSTTVYGKNPDNARSKAKAEIAQNIVSQIKSKTEMTDYSEENDGIFKESSTFTETSKIESNLTLLGFKEIGTPKRQKNGEFELKSYICVKDAAKGFLERQRLLSDSLGLATSMALNTKHPKQKNEAFRRTRTLWGEFMGIQILLDVLGVESPSAQIKKTYSKTMADYKNYCRSTKVSWQDAGNECSKAIFSKFSNRIKMEKAGCSGGLRLSLNCQERCANSSMEIECSINPSLAIESCGGEKYSMLKIKEPITGSHSHNKSLAMENMLDHLSGAAFLNEWEKEIKEWVPICE